MIKLESNSQSNSREIMAYQIYCAVGFLVAPFSAVALFRSQYLLAFPPLLTAVLCIVNVFHFRGYQGFLIKPSVVSVLCIEGVIVAIHELGAVGAYWAFPTLLALYWIHERRLALYLVTVFYIGVCISAYLAVPAETVVQIAATLLTTAVFFNIAAGILERQYKKLKNLTMTDHLTSAYNRRYMDGKLDELIERRKRTLGAAALIAVDVDHFKKINDAHGHSVGDQVLIDLVELIRSRVRVLDSVCRSGGEEFVIILPDTSAAQAKTLSEDLRISIGNAPLLADRQVTVSCGVSALELGDSRDSWLHRCDQALYTAKREGRNRVVVVNRYTAADVLVEA